MPYDPEELTALRLQVNMKREKKIKMETTCHVGKETGDLGHNKYQKGTDAPFDEKSQHKKEDVDNVKICKDGNNNTENKHDDNISNDNKYFKTEVDDDNKKTSTDTDEGDATYTSTDQGEDDSRSSRHEIYYDSAESSQKDDTSLTSKSDSVASVKNSGDESEKNEKILHKPDDRCTKSEKVEYKINTSKVNYEFKKTENTSTEDGSVSPTDEGDVTYTSTDQGEDDSRTSRHEIYYDSAESSQKDDTSLTSKSDSATSVKNSGDESEKTESNLHKPDDSCTKSEKAEYKINTSKVNYEFKKTKNTSTEDGSVSPTDEGDATYTSTDQGEDDSRTSRHEIYYDSAESSQKDDTSLTSKSDSAASVKNSGDESEKTERILHKPDDRCTKNEKVEYKINTSKVNYEFKKTENTSTEDGSVSPTDEGDATYTSTDQGEDDSRTSRHELYYDSAESSQKDDTSLTSKSDSVASVKNSGDESEKTERILHKQDDSCTKSEKAESKINTSKVKYEFKKTENTSTEDGSVSSTDDDSDSEETQKATYPKVFEISIDAEEYDQMRPLNQPDTKAQKLQFARGWTHIVAEKFSKVNPACILKFRYHKVQKHIKDSKRSRCFFLTQASCKHDNCGTWTMKIDKEPERGTRVCITVIQTRSVVKHKRGGPFKRQLTSTLRKRAQSKMQTESVDRVYWKSYNEMPEDELKAENYTKCQSESILRKAKSETKTGDMLHPEPFTELVILKDVFDIEEGYIQEISYIPFLTVLYNDDSINVAKKTIKNGSGVFYFDATGQVVQKLHQKRVLYYSMIINETTTPVVPVLEFISDQHATHHIIRPLLSFRAALGPKLQPRRIEVDFSWAIIHAVLLTFNNMSIHDYLQQCYQVCTQNDDFHYTVLHVCCIHILRAVRVTVKEKVKDEKMREIFLRMIALLQNTTSLQQAMNVWKTFCTVLNSRYKTKAVDKAVLKMNRMLKDASCDSLENEDDDFSVEDHCDSGLIGKDKVEKLGIRKRSPFRSLFIEHLVENEVEENDEVSANMYFQGEMINHIGQNYMPLYPLWSGCMLMDGKTRASNASVEAWMKIVKKDVLMGKKNLRVGEFIRTLRPVVAGRLRNVKMKQAEKGTMKARKRKLPAEDMHEAEESWQKKSKGKQRTSFLYSPAKNIPVPRKVKKTTQKRPMKVPSHADTKGKEKRPQNPPGLVNKENSCWLNSTLQAMAGMKRFYCKGDDRISSEVRRVVEHLRHLEDPYNVLDPEDLREYAWEDLSYARGQHQDGAEFVQNLMNRNKEELLQMQYKRQCRVCGLETKTEEQTNIVSVELASITPASVSDCLSEFSKLEILTGEDAPMCKQCKRNTNHSVQTSITKAEVLLMHLKRYKLSKSGRFMKENRDIRVNRVIGLKGCGVYRLRAVQCHIGSSMGSGHYITATLDDEWTTRRCDDTNITIAHPAYIDGAEIQKSAYVLYYQAMTLNDAHVLIRKLPDVSISLIGNIELTGRDLSTLLPGEQLNDQIINSYMSMISKKYPHTAAVDIYFSNCLVTKRDPGKFVKECMFVKRMILLPFIYANHWTLLVIRPATNSISVYDSANGNSYVTPQNIYTAKRPYMDVLRRISSIFSLRTFCGKKARSCRITSIIQNIWILRTISDVEVIAWNYLQEKRGDRYRVITVKTKASYLRKKMLFECLASTLL